MFLLEELFKPMSWKFRVSLPAIFEVNIVDTESNCITKLPFKVVQQRPCKVSLCIYSFPAIQK